MRFSSASSHHNNQRLPAGFAGRLRWAWMVSALFCAMFCLSLSAQHSHLEIGAAPDGPGSPLEFLNRDEFDMNMDVVLEMQDGQEEFFGGDFHSGLTISVRASSLAFGGPEPSHPLPGTRVAIEVIAFEGPPGGILSFWEGITAEPLWQLSEPPASDRSWMASENDGLPGQDPYGHVHGRRFSANVPGFYTLTIRAVDRSDNGPDGASLHAPSEPLSIRFKAGDAQEPPMEPVRRQPYFEGRLTHPLALDSQNSRLLAINNEESRVSVLAIPSVASTPPVLITEIPVGLSPVSIRIREEAGEAWVVNEVSDTISIISLETLAVIETVHVPDEPSDVVFADGKAFVVCSRDNALRVLDAGSRVEITTVALDGLFPRYLAVSPDGGSLFVSFLHSGNGTTILPASEDEPQPDPLNPDLPAPPAVSRIVPVNSPEVEYQVLDNDIAVVDTAGLSVSGYLTGLGTCLFDVLPSADGQSLISVCTEAHNHIAFEPDLNGRFIENRLVRVRVADGQADIMDFSTMERSGSYSGPVEAMAQPMNVIPSPSGTGWLVSAFGSDRLAHVSDQGQIVGYADLRNAPGSPFSEDTVRGPRGMVASPDTGALYVLNKLSRSLSVVDPVPMTVLGEVALSAYPFPDPEFLRGRGFLYDARLSADGGSSCASCHIDGDRDGVAWDLGDPLGDMLIVQGANLSAHSTTPRDRVLHPMKGPMTTQTLWGLEGGAPFHWRGDMPTIHSFNRVFPALLDAEPLDASSMDQLAEYLLSIDLHPNPFRNLDNSMKTSVHGGDPYRGEFLFNLHANHCAVCHSGDRGSDNNLDLAHEVGSSQPVKNPHLRTVYQRRFFNPRPGAVSLTGFGLGKDGTGFSLPIVHPYVLHELFQARDFSDVSAFVLSFDTGSPASTGRTVTVTPPAIGLISQSGILESFLQTATSGQSDVILTGIYRGRQNAFLYDHQTGTFTDAGGNTNPYQQIHAGMQPGDTLTWMCVPVDSGYAFLFDRDRNGLMDQQERDLALKIRRGNDRILLSLPQSLKGVSIWQSESITRGWTPFFHPNLISRSGSEIGWPTTPPNPDAQFLTIKPTSY